MQSQNTLELARQGDPKAIATILTYYLSQRFNTTASVIRLGNYLSVLIDATFIMDQVTIVRLVLDILSSLDIREIATIEIGAREMGHHEVQWSQTIELADIRTHGVAMNNDNLNFSTTEVDTSTAAVSSNALTDLESKIDSPTTTGSTESSISQSPDPDNSRLQDDDWDTALKKLLKRPEMLALVAFALILVLFDTYAEWISDIDPSKSLSGVKLARRLGVSTSTLKRYRERPNFREWSQDLDPDGIAWLYENNVFVPQLESLTNVAS